MNQGDALGWDMPPRWGYTGPMALLAMPEKYPGRKAFAL
jgi:hypothetical protein